jgi:predicted phosphoribosyltransferase
MPRSPAATRQGTAVALLTVVHPRSLPGKFPGRRQAGRLLAAALSGLAGRNDVIVLALPRGGVPVAHEVARVLGLPLDVFVVRKLSVPGHLDLAMGAVASGKVCVLNTRVIDFYRVPRRELEMTARRAQREVIAQERVYREVRAPLAIAGRTVILVDDGMATGMTMSAAVKAVRGRGVARVIVAVPLASREAGELLATSADEVVCLATPESLDRVADGYRAFPPVSDAQVSMLLHASSEPYAVPEAAAAAAPLRRADPAHGKGAVS